MEKLPKKQRVPSASRAGQRNLPAPSTAALTLLEGVLSHATASAADTPSERTTAILIDAACYGPSAAALRHGLTADYMRHLVCRYRSTADAIVRHRAHLTTAMCDSTVTALAMQIWTWAASVCVSPPVARTVEEAREIVKLMSTAGQVVGVVAAIADGVRDRTPQVGRLPPPRDMRQISASLQAAKTQLASHAPKTSTIPSESSTIPAISPDSADRDATLL